MPTLGKQTNAFFLDWRLFSVQQSHAQRARRQVRAVRAVHASTKYQQGHRL
jgi:hypothetical protein